VLVASSRNRMTLGNPDRRSPQEGEDEGEERAGDKGDR
jgi:hypothetical protein